MGESPKRKMLAVNCSPLTGALALVSRAYEVNEMLKRNVVLLRAIRFHDIGSTDGLLLNNAWVYLS